MSQTLHSKMASYLQFDKPVFVLSTQITVRPVWVNTTSVQSASLKKKCPPCGSDRVRTSPRGSVKLRTPLRGSVRVRTPPHGRIGSGVRVSASFQKNARLVGRLRSGPCLVADVVLADRANVVFTNTAVTHVIDVQLIHGMNTWYKTNSMLHAK